MVNLMFLQLLIHPSGTKEKAAWEMNDWERIEAAKKKKEEGNLLFKNGKYQRAGKKYEKVSGQ